MRLAPNHFCIVPPDHGVALLHGTSKSLLDMVKTLARKRAS